MLILKSPMQLQSLSGIQMYSDKLGEKIIANYQLIGMEITSADLLHMMVQEPELFLNAESFGIITIENPVYTANQIKLEIINQLINRLMLYFSPNFTYQDEVFVASVLQKIGVSDVKEFMQQVHRHMDHNLLLAKLCQAYGLQQKKIAETVQLFQTRLQQSYQETKEINLQNAWNRDYKFACYLHNEVFERLMTAECNHIVYSYYCQMDKRKTAVQGVREAAWAEQADVIQLSQMRKLMFEQTNPVAWQEDLYYERKHFAQKTLTEKIVVQRIVAAILENMVQKLHGVWLREKNAVSGTLWRDYTQTFCRSAADVLERFWYFQRKQTIEMQRYEAYLDRISILVENEWKLTQLLDQLDLFYAHGRPKEIRQRKLTDAWRASRGRNFPYSMNHADKEKTEREIVLSIWENQTLQKQLMGRIQLEERLAVQDYLRDIDLQEEQEYLNQEIQNNIDMLQRIVVEDLPQIGINHYFKKIQDSLQWQETNGQTLKTAQNFIHIKQNEEKEISEQESKITQDLIHIIRDKDKESLQNQQKSHYNYMDEFLQKYAEFVAEQEVPFSENKKLLDEINQHNLQMKHRLDREQNASDKNMIRHVAVDQKKARQGALYALENPQEALREIYMQATAIEEKLPPELERILRITDENTQLFYRQLLGYQTISSQTEKNHIQDNNFSSINTIKNDPQDNNLSNIDTIQNYIQDNNFSRIDTIKKEEQESNKLKLNELSSENNTANLENTKTRIQFLEEKEIAVKTSVSNLSVEKLFDTYNLEADNINGQSSVNHIETTLKQIEEQERKIYLENIAQPYTNVPKRLYLEHQSAANNKTTTENGDLQESQRLLQDKEFVKNAVSLENKEFSENLAFLQEQEWRGIDFVHKPELRLTEYLEDLKNRKLVSSDQIPQKKEFPTEMQTQLEQLKQQQLKQRELVQQQLQDIQQKLLRESREQFTQMANHSVKTQVHAISDIVYHELERRLKNEQRRRGY